MGFAEDVASDYVRRRAEKENVEEVKSPEEQVQEFVSRLQNQFPKAPYISKMAIQAAVQQLQLNIKITQELVIALENQLDYFK